LNDVVHPGKDWFITWRIKKFTKQEYEEYPKGIMDIEWTWVNVT